ncbi:MAG TPA: methyl-accepting chemotaxis protein [Solirubrobacteraceae bacterium]|nr:methyl-accepting chemotaxis protein [Solirubrobacteraceae bacterium]
MSVVASDPLLTQVRDRLASLESHCFAGLDSGLAALVAGDHTVSIVPATTPLDADGEDPVLNEIGELVNRLIVQAQSAVQNYNQLRGQLAAVLGEHSVLSDLSTRLHSLHDHCLTNLNAGLGAMVDGDLSVQVNPVTTPITGHPGESIGEFGELFNAMLIKAQGSLAGYNAVREQFQAALGDDSCLEALSARMNSLNSHCLAGLNDGLGAMAGGDLTVGVQAVTTPVEAHAGREIGALATVFNSMLGKAQNSLESYEAMRAKLNTMIAEIRNTSVTVAAASTQMAATSEETSRAVGEIANAVSDVAEGAERQVRSVEDAKLMAERVAAASQTSVESAHQTSRAASEAQDAAGEGANAVGRATETMQAVQESSNEVSEVIQALGTKSADIGGIAATITGIAQQTNLLALNAAIEAARAGDQGRGFAVVAEEVRKLAEESQRAAADIGSLSQEIQKETARAVQVVDTGARRSQEGVSVVEQARESFQRINESVASMGQRVEEISAAAQGIASDSQLMHTSMDEVASVAEQSSAATEEVSAATEQTSASAQQIAASAQQLASTAEELERLVGQFALAS